MILPVGILQGRLSPAQPGRPQQFPWATWRDEFAQARACGFTHFEWLIVAERLGDNPLLDAGGAAEIRRLAAAHDLRVGSACADCLIARRLVRASPAERSASAALLTRIVERSAEAGIAVVIVPAIEDASVVTDADVDDLIAGLRAPLAAASRLGVRLAIESDWPGAALAELLDRMGHPALGACYDSGNAAALGHDAAADVAALGRRVFAVHIKDRLRSGISVPLGDGDADIPGLLDSLGVTGYEGPVILETPRGADPIAMAQRHLDYLELVRAPLERR